jgi:hypothetical protein
VVVEEEDKAEKKKLGARKTRDQIERARRDRLKLRMLAV